MDEEDTEEKIHGTYCHRAKSYPSLPANYVSILDLKERWLKQKQARENPVHQEPAQASRVKEEDPDVLEKSGKQTDEAKEMFKAKKKKGKKKRKPKCKEDLKEVERKLEGISVSERVDEGKVKEEAVAVRVSRKKNVSGGRQLEGTSVKEGPILDADKEKDVTFRVLGKEDDINFNGHNGGRFGERSGGFGENWRFRRERKNRGFAENGMMRNNMIWVRKGESTTSSSNGNIYKQRLPRERKKVASDSIIEAEWRVK